MRGALTALILAAALVAVLKYEDDRWHLVDAIKEKPPELALLEGRPKILFIGNSFTSANDLPLTFSRVSRSLGENPGAEAYAPGAQTFEGHLKDPELTKRIMGRAWDIVVLQEQSQRPAFGDDQVEKETIQPALALDARIKAARPAARVVFYATWGRKNGDAANCKEIPEICTYDGQQARLDAAYGEMARRAQDALVPVGKAWRAVRAAHPELELYDKDGIHPSSRGTYLAACAFYAVIYKKSPVGADKLGLGADAEILQKAAAEAAGATSPAPSAPKP